MTDFRVAVGARFDENFTSPELQYDPQHVRWLARMYSVENGRKNFTDLPMHECTEEDLIDFYPI